MAGAEDNNPAQVLKIIYNIPDMVAATRSAYYTIHHSFAPAEVVLRKGVHLISIQSNRAIFMQVDEDVDLFNPKLYPITSLAQTQLAKFMIILPIGYFNDLVDQIDISDRKVVWMFHTTRCGSTTWVQIFNSLPNWTVFSELQTLPYTHLFGDKNYLTIHKFSKSPEFRHFVISYVKMHVHHVPAGGSLFWKSTPMDNYMIDMISEVFPDHQMLLAYRDILPSIGSFHTTFASMATVAATYKALSADPYNETSEFIRMMRMHGTNSYDHNFSVNLIHQVKPQMVVEWLTFKWAATLHAILENVQNGAQIRSIKYENFQLQQQKCIEKVFQFCNVNEEYVTTACECLHKDSQEGTWLSQKSRQARTANKWSRTEDVVRRCNMILNAFNLKDIDSHIDLDIEL